MFLCYFFRNIVFSYFFYVYLVYEFMIIDNIR